MRLFIALWPPAPWRCALAPVTEELRSRTPRGSTRFVAPDQWHVTLRFLGDVTDAPGRLAQLEEALRRSIAACRSFTLALAGLGCFPSLTRPRVLWAGVSGDTEQLQILQHRVAEATHPFAVSPLEPDFHPHVTLARFREVRRSEAADLAHALKAAAPQAVEPWLVDEVHLMESQLRNEGASYHVRSVFRLGTAP